MKTAYQVEYLALDGTGPWYMGPHDRGTAIRLFHVLKKTGFHVRIRKIQGTILPQYDTFPKEVDS